MYIIMAKGEDGMEFRPSPGANYVNEQGAYNDLPYIRENYPEAKLWVEELRDKNYFMKKHNAHLDADGEELY